MNNGPWPLARLRTDSAWLRSARRSTGIEKLPKICWQISLVVSCAIATIGHANAQTSTAPRLTKPDLIYEGAFRVPQGGSEDFTFDYGGRGIAVNSANNSLFLIGHDQRQRTAEIRIPTVVNSSNMSDLNTATIVQDFRNATEGRLNSVNSADSNSKKVGGHLVYRDKLYLTGLSSYDGNGTQDKSHFMRPLSLSDTGQVVGPVAVGSRVHFTSAYMTLIPAEWQSVLGGPALTGNCCRSIIGNQSAGPAVSVFDPADIDAGTSVSATDLVYYPSSDPLGPGVSTQNPFFNLTTRVEGVVFPNGTRSVLFFGSHGIGPYCYGFGSDCGDPTKADKGTHAYPYVYQVWAYDANDFADVVNGTRSANGLQPYDVWTFNVPFESNDAHLFGGAAYDPATDKIYMSMMRGDSKAPLIHVFRINRGPRPVAPGNFDAQ